MTPPEDAGGDPTAATPPGTRLAQLLASELVAREDGPLERLELVDVRDADALDPDEFGAFAFGVVLRTDDARGRLADVYAHDDRARVEFRAGLDAFPEAAREADLRVRPKAVDPPRVLVFVEDGGQVKRALSAVRAAIDAHDAADEGGIDADGGSD